ncbi:MAG: hypothetical protein JSU06_12955 [Actinobacteria bacterium]|nr:hypothetical protein [Actinomycetota bacterium]
MTQILVVTEASGAEGKVVYSESVGSVHLEGRAGAQLVERLRWAVGDAQVAEHRARLRAATRPGTKHPAAA